jgi:hypothetical protein
MLRFISCQHATLLIEQRAEQPLSALEHTALWIHLRYCHLCSRYEQQTLLINQLAQAAVAHSAVEVGLSAQARERLRQCLANVLPPGLG